ncbi:hypothetical protein [Spongorhabdus nitratireducens]
MYLLIELYFYFPVTAANKHPMKLISVLSLFVFIACAQANNGEGRNTTEIPCNSGFFLQANHSGQFYYAIFLLQPDFTPPHTKAHTLYANLKSFGYCEPIHFKSTCLSENESGNPETLLLFISPPPDQGVNIAVACWRLSSLHSRGSPLPSDFSPSVSRSSRHGKQYAVLYQGEEWELSYHGEHGLQHVMTRDGIKKTHGTVCTTAHFEKSPLQTPLLMWLPSISNFPKALSEEIRQQLRQMQLIADVVLACKVSGSPTLTLASTQEGEEDSERITRQCAAISLDHSTVTETQACSRASTEPFLAPPEESFSDLLHNSGFLQKDCRILCQSATELFNQLSQVERDELYLALLTKSMVPPLVNTTNDMLTLFSNLQKHMGEPWDYQGLLCWLGLAAKKHGQRLSVQTVNTLRVYEPMIRRWIDVPCLFFGIKRINNLNKCLAFIAGHVGYAALTKDLLEFFTEYYPDRLPGRFNKKCTADIQKLWTELHVALGELIYSDLYLENNALLVTFLQYYLSTVCTVNSLYVQCVLTLLPAACRNKTMAGLELTVSAPIIFNSQPDEHSESSTAIPSLWVRNTADHLPEKHMGRLKGKAEPLRPVKVSEREQPVIEQHQLTSDKKQLLEQLRSQKQAYARLQQDYSIHHQAHALYRARTGKRLMEAVGRTEDLEKKLESTEGLLSTCQNRLEMYHRKWPETYARIAEVRSQLEMTFFELQQHLNSMKKLLPANDSDRLLSCISLMEKEGHRHWSSLQQVLNSRSVDIVYLKCVICYELAKKAFVGANCGHIYCEACIDKNMRRTDYDYCGYCKKWTHFQRIYN